MLNKKSVTLLLTFLLLTIAVTSCNYTDIHVENLEDSKPQNIITKEVTGEVKVERIESFRNIKGGFTNYNVKFIGVEYPSATMYQEAHVAMFHSSDLGLAIHNKLIKEGTQIPAKFTIKEVDGAVKNVTIKEIMEVD